MTSIHMIYCLATPMWSRAYHFQTCLTVQVAIAQQQEWLALAGHLTPQMLLVRPDGHICWIVDGTDQKLGQSQAKDSFVNVLRALHLIR